MSRRDVEPACALPRRRSLILVSPQLIDSRADLPVSILTCALERGVNVGSFKVRECHDRATTDRWLVVERRQDRGPGPVVANRAEGRDRRFATACVVVRRRDHAQLVDGTDVKMFAQRKDCAVHNQRVLVVQTSQHCPEEFVVNLINMGDQVERFSSDIDVPVINRGQPLVISDEPLTSHSSKRENSTSRDVANQVGAQYRNVVIANGETGAQKRFVWALR